MCQSFFVRKSCSYLGIGAFLLSFFNKSLKYNSHYCLYLYAIYQVNKKIKTRICAEAILVILKDDGKASKSLLIPFLSRVVNVYQSC